MADNVDAFDIVVRFSSGTPDVVLRARTPSSTTNLSLKQLIRAHLQPPASTSRLRLIHAGKVLPDAAALSKSLNVTIPPPPPQPGDGKRSAKAKGKLPVRESVPVIARVYVHCSVGDPLTPSELIEEARQAEDADAALKFNDASSVFPPSVSTEDAQDSATPGPRGFDRLLSAGFSTAEVATLRTQFLAIQAQTHTPDTMPSGAQLLALEERWLDDGSNPANAGGAEDAGGFGFEAAGGLDDLLWGNLIGFFWPLGAMVWLMREEGVWSPRRQIAVLSGFLANLAFGFLRVMV